MSEIDSLVDEHCAEITMLKYSSGVHQNVTSGARHCADKERTKPWICRYGVVGFELPMLRLSDGILPLMQ